MKYQAAFKHAEEFKKKLEPCCHRIEIAGSIRRKKLDNIKDVEIVMIPRPDKVYELKQFFDSQNVVKGSFPHSCGFLQIRTSLCMIDVFVTTPECWGCIYLIRTGPAEYSERLMKYAIKKGFRSHKGRLWKLDNHNRLHYPVYTPEERDVYRELGLHWQEPKDRK